MSFQDQEYLDLSSFVLPLVVLGRKASFNSIIKIPHSQQRLQLQCSASQGPFKLVNYMLGHSVEVGDAEWAPQNIQFDERGWARFQNGEAVHKYMQTTFSDENSELEKFFYIMHEGEKICSRFR